MEDVPRIMAPSPSRKAPRDTRDVKPSSTPVAMATLSGRPSSSASSLRRTPTFSPGVVHRATELISVLVRKARPQGLHEVPVREALFRAPVGLEAHGAGAPVNFAGKPVGEKFAQVKGQVDLFVDFRGFVPESSAISAASIRC